jgi:hypothetical protein
MDGQRIFARWSRHTLVTILFYDHVSDYVGYRLNKLYLKAENRPVPRPLLAHHPRKEFSPDAYKGNVAGLKITAHFAQPNSIEWEPALEWRRLTWAYDKTKADRRKEHVNQLASLMRQYVEVCPASTIQWRSGLRSICRRCGTLVSVHTTKL